MKQSASSICTSLLLILLFACSKNFLERLPQGSPTSATFFNDSTSALQAVNACYASLRDFGAVANAFVSITSITSDDADKGSTPGDAPMPTQLDNFTFNASNSMVNMYWGALYSGIERCNVVLVNVPAIKMDETLKTRFLAEARFIRGYFYFCLVRTYGGVPLVDHLLSPNEYGLPRKSAADIYTFIESDLTYAAGILPLKSQYAPADLGRVTKGAAQGILAKVELYNKNWGEVVALTNEIMNSGQYNLNTPYGKIFTPQGENGPESIFEIQCVSNPQQIGGSQYAQFQGIRSATLNLGYGLNVPSENLLASYETGDPRKDATILFRGQSTGAGEIVPTDATQPYFNKKVYLGPADRPSFDMQGAGVNVRILRYADVMLMHAEAANELGQTELAQQDINSIRSRARGDLPTTILPPVPLSDQNTLRTLIRKERHIELAMEHERFYDLVRWNIADTVLHAAGKTNFTKGKNELMPIPQLEIDKSNGLLVQNLGY